MGTKRSAADSTTGDACRICRDGLAPPFAFSVAEGVETRAELDVLRGLGVDLFQGYLFARPAFESLPEVTF